MNKNYHASISHWHPHLFLGAFNVCNIFSKSAVMSKKFLLVLDDIWEEEEERDKRKWESVLAPLAYGSLGSKILLTTRMDSVASMIAKVIKNKKETFSLKGLEEDECLQLLNNHAFVDVENPDDHKKLKFISGEIVKKLSGSPLAAKVIGGVLSSNFDERHWRKVLNSDFGSAEFIQNDIFSIIRLSYTFLSIPLQTCFAFCSVFSQDFEFDKEDLVRMWIALGFIQPPSTSRENLEDIGGKYFDTLVKKSFFDKFENEDRAWYKMHDLLHELAQSISAQECFRVVDDEALLFKIPDTIRHLSVEIKNLDVLGKMRKLKNLRSLFLTCDSCNQGFVEVPTDVFEASRSIRLLHINGSSLKIIPEAIINLIHLRYLKIYDTDITQLPRSISHLYHLQFIIHEMWLLSDVRDDFLPRDINNLSNLHYLKLHLRPFPAICGIGKLKHLQELEGFYVRNEIGYRIEELKHMNDLRHLKIKFLENVRDAEEACSAKFCDKKNLMNLSLEWGGNTGRRNIVIPDLDEKLLDNIQPHNNLRNLIINAYMGVRPAIWMNNPHLIHNLECIELRKCLEWQTLPPFGQLPFLKSLSLSNMPKVKRLDNRFHGNDMYCIFPSLEVLRIEELEALEDWFDARVTATDDCLFPCLTELYLLDCPKLLELPYIPPKLKILEIYNIWWKTLNFCSISKFVSLNTLEVHHCPKITYIHLAAEIARLAALKRLEIEGCPSLISLGEHLEVKTIENSKLILSELFINDPIVLQMEPLRSITSLQELTIQWNDELVSFPIETEQWFLQELRVRLLLVRFVRNCWSIVWRILFKEGLSRVQWTKPESNIPITWYKRHFDTPSGKDPVIIDMSTMAKGLVWVNGEGIGQYWVSNLSPLGTPTQTVYHIPRSFLKQTKKNLLVVLEESGGNPDGIQILTVRRDDICTYVSEYHPGVIKSWSRKEGQLRSVAEDVKPESHLKCPDNKVIQAITFASFGNPTGMCGNYTIGSCHAPQTQHVVEKACLGKASCVLPVEWEAYGADADCPETTATLAVQVFCGHK